MKNRFAAIRHHLEEQEADAVVLSFLPDIRWACGFTGSNAILVVSSDAAHFLSDGRYTAQAHREVREADVHIPEGNLFEHVADKALLRSESTVLFQADHVTVAEHAQLEDHFPSVVWQSVSDLLVEDVAAKDDSEIEHVHAAQGITDEVFDHLCRTIKRGMTERAIAAEIVYQHLKRGAERMAFDPIVASGPNGALPHARPTNRKLQRGDLVVIDMGGVVDGYASDMTRTVAIGPASESARRHYATVLEAQQHAIDTVHAGMTGAELDAMAREVLDEAEIGAYFTHSLGHGIGLQTHEWPRLSQRVEHVLPAGATITIEPGVYMPDQYGIRIEDIVVVRSDGCDNLTGASKQLIEL